MQSTEPLDASTSALALKSLFQNNFLNDFFNKSKLSKAIKAAHMRKINACTSVPLFQHIINTADVIDVVTNPAIAAEQEQLLAHYVQHINKSMVDIDYLTLEVNLKSSDIDKLLSKEDGILRVKTQSRSSSLTVTSHNAKNKNTGFKAKDKKPFFTKYFQILVDNDAYKYVNIYFADKSHVRNSDRVLTHNLEIEFIPSRFSSGMIKLVFSHLKSVFMSNRYPQIIRNAVVQRLDLGINLYGVSQLFCVIDTLNNKTSSGRCYPEDNDCLAMTTVLGSSDNSHAILYDKLAKELTKFFEEASVGLQENINDLLDEIGRSDDVYATLLTTARYEFSHIDNFYLQHSGSEKNNKVRIKLHQLAQIESEFANTVFVKPTALAKLKPATLKKLVRDKSLNHVSKLRDFFKSEDAYLQFDNGQVRDAFLPLLSELRSCIVEPKKADVDSPFNYTALVQEAKHSLLPVKQILQERCSDRDPIIKSDLNAIYVEGTPGSGKTTLMVDRVVYLLNQRIPPEQICVLTFTNDAKRHFQKALKVKLKKMELSASQVFVGTFSGWCNQVLKIYRPSKILDADSAEVVINEFIDELASEEICQSESMRSGILNTINFSTNFNEPHIPTSIRNVAPELAVYEKLISKIFRRYLKYKKRSQYRDFNDILLDMSKYLEESKNAESLVKKFQYIFLDEAQDSNDVQWEILRKLHEHSANIFCVGDPAQSIYGFRGARVDALANFTMTFRKAKKFSLRECYRSNSGIVNFCNSIRNGISRDLTVAFTKRDSKYLPRVQQIADFETAISELLRDLAKIERLKPDVSILVLAPYNDMVNELEEAACKFSSRLTIRFRNIHQAKGLEDDIVFYFDKSLGRGRMSSRKQEMCNFYVASSRARHKFKIFHNPDRTPYYDTTKGQSKKASTKHIINDINRSLYK